MELNLRSPLAGAFLAGILILLHVPPVNAATVVQPDVRAGVTYMDNGGLTGEEDVSAAGAEVQAQLKLGFVDERGSLTLIPMIRAAQFSDEGVSDREEQQIQLNWLRNFQTAATNTLLSFDRQDLFSSELRDISLDPDEIPVEDDADTGVVESESTRNRIHFRQDFAKAIGQRSGIAVALGYTDLSYDDSAFVDRIDFDRIQLDGGWRRALTERSDVTLLVGGDRYDGENGVTVDSVGAGLGFDLETTETTRLFVRAGYQNSSTEDEFQDYGSDSEFIFSVGGEKNTELTRLRGDISRDVRPTSVGGVTTETGLSLYYDRRLSERLRFGAGIAAFRQERSINLGVNDDRDYFSGKLQLAYRLTEQWSIEGLFRHSQQDFENPAILGGSSTEDRNRVLLSVRWTGLNEVRVPRDPRFLRRGY
jgi:hypothetical protein